MNGNGINNEIVIIRIKRLERKVKLYYLSVHYYRKTETGQVTQKRTAGKVLGAQTGRDRREPV